ncbi:hypothetical protein JYG23_14390 [Sedimentibacter sp. zth1]|uniref:hypothetical protein n=1 Tax=Sedimentibacter sp. zth1 TaxID=2816908 RepID=UPI001A92A3ED|nr:hypothetical protein [Sedimentibacter sp. zth1]QSX05833.1 hypothetical protein JYG23_14390 [Sedimentibacter sp. zth1]
MIIEEQIIEFVELISKNKQYDENLNHKLSLDDKYEIKAKHEKIENDECVYALTLWDKETNKQIDNVFSDIDDEQIEDIIFFFIEEYIK